MKKTVILNLSLALVYILAGKFGLSLAFDNPSTTAIWAPTGIALAAILIFGKRVIPAIFLGAFVVNLTTAGTVLTSLGIALGNTLEGVVGAYLVKKFANGVHAFESVADIFKFVFYASMLSTTISANIGVLTLIFGGLAKWSNFLSLWTTWWLGDMGGSMIITPLLLVWWTHHKISFKYKPALHFLISILTLFVVTGLIFSKIVPYPYLYIPIGVWIAFWFGRRGATVATLIVSAITIYYTLHNIGPFVTYSVNYSLVQLQLFLNVFSLTSLIFATTVLVMNKNRIVIATHEQRFKALIEKSFDAVVLIEANSKILYASPSVKRLLGYMPEEIEGTVGFDLIAPEDKVRTMATLAQLVLKPGGAVTIEYRAIRKERTIIWVEATGTNLLLDPNINAVVVNFHDITDKKLSEQKLLQDQMKDQAMLSSIGEGIIATDRTGKITMINKAACDMLGWQEKEILDKLIVAAIPMENDLGKIVPVTERPMTKLLTKGKSAVTSHTAKYIKKDGTKFSIDLTITPLIVDDVVMGTIEVFHDITKEKEIDKAKTEFVSVASHQLRTPLATINWYIEELLRTGQDLSKKQSSYLGEVYSASRRMVNLINALLNASRLELGTFKVEPKEVALVGIIQQVLKELRPQMQEKNIALEEQYQQNLPVMSADANLFTIIMQNLLSNAMKYSQKNGKIIVKVTSDSNGFLIEVIDNGYGIPQNQTTKVFSKLFRADNARSIDPEGTGLGLYIVKEIVDTTGGKIWFVSKENKGTTFSITFPLSGMRQKEGQKLID